MRDAPQRLSGIVERIVQIIGGSFGCQLRPEEVHRLFGEGDVP